MYTARELNLKLLACLLIGSSLLYTKAAENPFVYRVRVDGCPALGNTALTGFVVEGYEGLVTALHGVVGCEPTSIKATNAYTEKEWQNLAQLEIIAVDYDRDIALLKPMAGNLPPGGLSTSSYNPTSSGELSTFGYPAGIEGQLPAKGGNGELQPLVKLIPPGEIAIAARARGSPNIDIDANVQAIVLQAAISPGYSGAPVFDQDDNVIGIVQGNIPNSFQGWAMPWDEIELTALAANSELEAMLEDLASPDKSGLLTGSFIGSGILTSDLPTDKTFNLRDQNREHLYDYEENERCEVETYTPDSGYRFSGVFEVEVQAAVAADEPLVNVLDGGQTLEAQYCVSAGPSLAGNQWEGFLEATITAEQIPVVD